MMRITKSNWQVVLLGCAAMLAAVLVPTSEDALADAVEPKGKIVEIAPTSNDDLPTIHDETVIEEENEIADHKSVCVAATSTTRCYARSSSWRPIWES